MDAQVLVVGESLVDVVHRASGERVEYAGGSAANVAVALARLGRPVRFATAFADDHHGSMVRDYLEAAGVRLACDPAAIDRTATAAATIGADGAASYEFDLDWRLLPVEREPAPVAVHTCSLGAVLAPGAEDVLTLLEELRGAATVTYDVNARPAITGTGPDVVARVERVARLADLVRASDEDLEALWPELDLAEAVAHLRGLGAAVVVVTRGADGASWTSAQGEVVVASRRVEVADTIGAGDTFGAALVDALAERGLLGGRLGPIGDDVVVEVLEHAARAAAITVSRPGADPPWRHEMA
ncbi:MULTISPECIES: PfkB family carbohydrate kinase [unclassified Nocardioides]|uniref:PfkB family carbohydrate kinase n=1 Tax=unclassified Nocardioides TaxID=2615069 RepID=UPI000A920E6F|nr:MULTISPECIES: PfkB family carbohydrate kinase [unclassified Nocardioides]